MKIENIWVFLLGFGILAAVVFGQKKLRDNYLNVLTKALADKDYALFEKKASSMAAKLLFDSFSICYMKLNSAFLQNDKNEIDKAFKEFDYIDVSPKQMDDLYSKVFNYYMSNQYFDEAKNVLDKIHKNLKKSPLNRQCTMIYDIYALKSDKYLDELIEECEGTPVNQRGFVEMLISDSYKNKGDESNAKKYKNLSLAHFKALENDIRKGKKNGTAAKR